MDTLKFELALLGNRVTRLSRHWDAGRYSSRPWST